ncbi:WD repeat-containing protein 76 [Heterocephalus glaber]|uniref:WD repeat-containing protein 76 n=1 Tax=Heterocephalus glaber TaxID=10181 RepID=G5BM58_HETGA|nr:WD repeat-containing protein 76 [Heterocephalus glaber]
MSRPGADCEGEAGSGVRAEAQVNEFKENQDVTYASLRPVQTTVLGKTAKVYLTPFSLSDYKLEQPKHSKSLSEKNSNYTMVCQKSELKKTCEEILTPKMKAIPSKAESTLQKLSLDVHTESNKSGHKSPSAATVLSADLESSDEDNTPGMSAARLREMIKKRQPPKFKRKKPKKRENEIGCRRSMRLLKVNPSEISIPAPPTAPILVENENPLLPPGPLEMIPENADDNHELFKGFLQTWAEMNKVYRNESRSLSSFDFLAESAATLLVGHWDGALSLVDRRTPGTSYEKLINSSMTKIRTVHMHPVHRQYFITAGLRDTHVYDARYLNPRRSQPLVSLTEHTKSIASAYFSPVTGNRVVSTCADCKLRIFDSSCVSSQMPLLTSIRHNTVTGRWLTRFQAVWDPKQEDCIIVGSMVHPRRVEVFHETGKGVHSLLGECLGSVCSINAMHPTRYVLAGGNSSGRLHVFMKPGSC